MKNKSLIPTIIAAILVLIIIFLIINKLNTEKNGVELDSSQFEKLLLIVPAMFLGIVLFFFGKSLFESRRFEKKLFIYLKEHQYNIISSEKEELGIRISLGWRRFFLLTITCKNEFGIFIIKEPFQRTTVIPMGKHYYGKERIIVFQSKEGLVKKKVIINNEEKNYFGDPKINSLVEKIRCNLKWVSINIATNNKETIYTESSGLVPIKNFERITAALEILPLIKEECVKKNE